MEAAFALVVLVFFICSILTGCQTKLAAGGVYNGDTTLYEADNAIVQGHAVLQDFVNWEANYRDTLLKVNPGIKAFADKVVSEGAQWFVSAAALRDAYKSNPNSDTRTTLQTAVDVIKSAIREASGYLTTNKTLAPPPAASKPTAMLQWNQFPTSRDVYASSLTMARLGH